MNNSLAQQVADLMKDKRKRLGITQQDLADRLGCGVEYVRSLEGAYKNPTLKQVGRIFQALKTDLTLKMK